MLDPFLAGVLADWEGTTSATFVRLLMRSFLLGSPAVPSTGISRLPELMAASLPAGTVRLDQRVTEVGEEHVRTADEEIRADAVVVAASTAGGRRADRDPGTADEGADHVLAHRSRAAERGEAAARRRRPPGPAGQLGGGDQRGSRLTRRPVAC